METKDGPRETGNIQTFGNNGWNPAFGEKLYVGRPNLGDKEQLLERSNDVLDSGWLTNNGRYLQEFEQMVAALTGVKHCIAVCNATIGLKIAIRALGLQGEVIVPSFTFAATAHALQWQGITPVFCDVDPITHSLDPHDVERSITRHTSGIIGVHLWGNACDAKALEKIARKRRLKLLFDAAHAFGCSYNGSMIGNFGDAEVFSFHATKFCNSFEGGAITTSNGELANKIRALRNFGISQEGVVSEVGTNGKMSEVSAAMGITSLESLDEFIALNRANYLAYQKHLNGIPGVKLFQLNEAGENYYQYVIVEVDEAAGISRNELLAILHAENVMAKSYFSPGCHRMEAYRHTWSNRNRRLPVTEWLSDRTIALPTGSAVREADVAMICEIVRSAIRQSKWVRQELAAQAAIRRREDPAQAGRIHFLTLIGLLGLMLTGTMTPFRAIFAYVLNGLPAFAWMMWRLWKIYRPRWECVTQSIRELLPYGLRAYGIDLLGTLSLQIDQVMVVGFLSPAAMGTYVVALNLSRVLQLFQQAVVMVLFPKASARPVEEVLALTGRAVRISSVFTALAGIGVLLWGQWLLRLLYGREFVAATNLLRLLTLEAILSSTTLVLAQAFMALGKPGTVTILQGVGLALSVPLMLIFISRFGLLGAGISLAISSAVRLALMLMYFPWLLKERAPKLLFGHDDWMFLRRQLVKIQA